MEVDPNRATLLLFLFIGRTTTVLASLDSIFAHIVDMYGQRRTAPPPGLNAGPWSISYYESYSIHPGPLSALRCHESAIATVCKQSQRHHHPERLGSVRDRMLGVSKLASERVDWRLGAPVAADGIGTVYIRLRVVAARARSRASSAPRGAAGVRLRPSIASGG